eukprot:4683918-Ditylum_brightwellii.AAC.1
MDGNVANANATLIENALTRSNEAYLAYAFLPGANRKKYEQLLEDLANSAKTLPGLNCNHRLTKDPGPARHGWTTVRPEFQTPQHWSYVRQRRNEENSNDT